MRRTILAIAVLLALLAAGVFWISGEEEQSLGSAVSVAEAMSSDTTGFARAQTVRDFVFPEDHGPHPDFKTEWWYYTGNLETPEGRHFGYELTIFRSAMRPDTLGVASDWSTRQLYMAHLGLTDVEGEGFYSFERFSRGAAGLAGAQADPFRVWLEDWVISAGPSGPPAFRVRAVSDEGTGIDLQMRPRKPMVLQGDRGLDQKGEELGNASYYYSFTRLGTEGEVLVEGERFPVEGLSWMDREWSTSALGEGQVGWDWFALQLDDGRDMMYYQLRERGGTVSEDSDGVLVLEDGQKITLSREDVELEVLRRWTSPTSGGSYPVEWRLRVPSEGLDLHLEGYLDDQEMDVTVRYWEGAVRIDGTSDGQPVSGSGYVEMTGYDEEGATPRMAARNE